MELESFVSVCLLDIPWDVKISVLYPQLELEDLSHLACTCRALRIEMESDDIWNHLLKQLKLKHWDRWLDRLSERTLTYYPKLLFAVLKIILTHRTPIMTYVSSGKPGDVVTLSSALVDLLVHLQDLFPLPAHLSLLFYLFTYARHGSSVHLSGKVGFCHKEFKLTHAKLLPWLASHFKESGSMTRREKFRQNRFIRTFCEPFATLTFSFLAKWRLKPIFARNKVLDSDLHPLPAKYDYWLFDFATASPLCPQEVKAALEYHRYNKKPPARPYNGRRRGWSNAPKAPGRGYNDHYEDYASDDFEDYGH